MNARQRRFVAEYLKSLNATQAYKKAGYKATGRAAENNASRLLGDAGVKEAIAAGLAHQAEEAKVDAVKVTRGLLREATSTAKKSTQSARVRAWELLGKTVGMFSDRVEHTGKGGGAIQFEGLSDDELSRRIAELESRILSPAAGQGQGEGGEGGAGPAAS